MINPHFTWHPADPWTVIEFSLADMTDLSLLEDMEEELVRFVEDRGLKHIVLDFHRVQYVSSHAIVIVIKLSKMLGILPHSKLVLCGVPPKIMDLLKILKLDKLYRIVSTRQDAHALAV